MGKLIYSTITSLDGFTEDADGRFQWGAPDDEVSAFVNDLERSHGMQLYGRRMYEVMTFWQTAEIEDEDVVSREFAEKWRAAEKIVFSRTLTSVSSDHTRIERAFNAGTIRQWKSDASADLTIAGAEIAGHAMRENLVDECHLFVAPLLVGGGKRTLPSGVSTRMELLDERRFNSGFVYLRYGFAPATV